MKYFLFLLLLFPSFALAQSCPAFSFKVYNDGFSGSNTDLMIDLGTTIGLPYSYTDACQITGLKSVSTMGETGGNVGNVASATCTNYQAGTGVNLNKGINLVIPLEFRLEKNTTGGNLSIIVSLFRPSNPNSFQNFALQNFNTNSTTRNGTYSNLANSLNLNGAPPSGMASMVANGGTTTFQRFTELEIRAILQGPLAKSHYEDVIEVEIQPSGCTIP